MQVKPQCLECKHYLGDNKCSAYEEIPLVILAGWHDHTEPYKGDNGIKFEPIE